MAKQTKLELMRQHDEAARATRDPIALLQAVVDVLGCPVAELELRIAALRIEAFKRKESERDA